SPEVIAVNGGSATLDANLYGNDSPALEDKLREANRQLVQAFNQNEKLVNALYEAREQITALKEEVDKLCAPPSTYGVYLAANEDHTVTILSQGRKVKVNLHPSIKPRDPQARPGAHPQRGPQRHRGRRLRDSGRGRHPQGAARPRARPRHPPRRRGEGWHHRRAPTRAAAENRRPSAAGLEVRLSPRKAPEERSQRSHARGSARHRLR